MGSDSWPWTDSQRSNSDRTGWLPSLILVQKSTVYIFDIFIRYQTPVSSSCLHSSKLYITFWTTLIISIYENSVASTRIAILWCEIFPRNNKLLPGQLAWNSLCEIISIFSPQNANTLEKTKWGQFFFLAAMVKSLKVSLRFYFVSLLHFLVLSHFGRL